MSSLDRTFSALSDPTRRAILARLTLGEASASELAAPFRVSQPAISRHLRVLQEASLITRERVGQQQICRLDARALATARDWLETYRQFWTGALDRLDRHLNPTGDQIE